MLGLGIRLWLRCSSNSSFISLLGYYCYSSSAALAQNFISSFFLWSFSMSYSSKQACLIHQWRCLVLTRQEDIKN